MVELKKIKDNRNFFLCPYTYLGFYYQLPETILFKKKKTENKKNHNNLAQSNDDIMYRKIQMISLLLWHISYLIKYLKQILQPNAFHMYPPEQ